MPRSYLGCSWSGRVSQPPSSASIGSGRVVPLQLRRGRDRRRLQDALPGGRAGVEVHRVGRGVDDQHAPPAEGLHHRRHPGDEALQAHLGAPAGVVIPDVAEHERRLRRAQATVSVCGPRRRSRPGARGAAGARAAAGSRSRPSVLSSPSCPGRRPAPPGRLAAPAGGRAQDSAGPETRGGGVHLRGGRCGRRRARGESPARGRLRPRRRRPAQERHPARLRHAPAGVAQGVVRRAGGAGAAGGRRAPGLLARRRRRRRPPAAGGGASAGPERRRGRRALRVGLGRGLVGDEQPPPGLLHRAHLVGALPVADHAPPAQRHGAALVPPLPGEQRLGLDRPAVRRPAGRPAEHAGHARALPAGLHRRLPGGADRDAAGPDPHPGGAGLRAAAPAAPLPDDQRRGVPHPADGRPPGEQHEPARGGRRGVAGQRDGRPSAGT